MSNPQAREKGNSSILFFHFEKYNIELFPFQCTNTLDNAAVFSLAKYGGFFFRFQFSKQLIDKHT
jgi:hypothetical protein